MSPLRTSVRAVTTAVAALPLVLLAAPAHAADPAAPTFTCDGWWRYNGVIVWSGVATAPADAHGGVRQLKLTCVYENPSGRNVSHNETDAPVVATAGGGLMPAGEMSHCGTATVIYQDAHTVTVSTC